MQFRRNSKTAGAATGFEQRRRVEYCDSERLRTCILNERLYGVDSYKVKVHALLYKQSNNLTKETTLGPMSGRQSGIALPIEPLFMRPQR